MTEVFNIIIDRFNNDRFSNLFVDGEFLVFRVGWFLRFVRFLGVPVFILNRVPNCFGVEFIGSFSYGGFSHGVHSIHYIIVNNDSYGFSYIMRSGFVDIDEFFDIDSLIGVFRG